MRPFLLPVITATGLLLAPLVLPMPAGAQETRRGADYAREGVRSGEFVRLESLITDAERRYPGRVVEVELDDDDDEYEIEILMADGRVVELTYDARNGRLLKVEIDD